jgi:hypothetical protein
MAGRDTGGRESWLFDELLPRILMPLLTVLTAVALFPVLNAAVDDSPPSGYAAVVILSVLLAVAEYNLLMLVLRHRPNWHPGVGSRAGRLWLGGIVVALLFAAGLFAYEYQGQRTSRDWRAREEREQRERAELERQASAGIQRYEQLRAAREAGNATAASQPSRQPAVAPGKRPPPPPPPTPTRPQQDTPGTAALFGTWVGSRGKPRDADYLDWRVQLKPAREAGYVLNSLRLSIGGPCAWTRSGDTVLLTSTHEAGRRPANEPLPLTLTVRGGEETILVTPEGLELRREIGPER